MPRALPPFVALLLTSSAHTQWLPVDTSVHVTALFSAGDTLIWGTDDGVIRWSDDQGQTWTDISGTLPPGYVDNIGKGAGERLFCSVGSLVFRADVLGNWEGAASLETGATCMAWDDSLILAGAELSGGLRRSVDNGMTWSSVGAPMANSYLTSVTTDGNTIWASCFGGDAMLSSDGGSTWSAIPGLSGSAVFCLFFSDGLYAGDDSDIHSPGAPWNTFPADAQILDIERSAGYLAACGTFSGVFASPYPYTTWQTIEADYTTSQINAIAFVGTLIYAGNSDGLWKLDLDTWSGIPAAFQPERVLLWPNPAWQEFTFSLPGNVRGPVEVDILDPSGRVVRSRSLAPTMQSMSVSGLAPGRYMARFRTATGIVTSTLEIAQ